MEDKTRLLNEGVGNNEFTQILQEDEQTQMLTELAEDDTTQVLLEDDENKTQMLTESAEDDATQMLIEEETDKTQMLAEELGEVPTEILLTPKMCLKCFHTYKGGRFCPYCGEMAKESEEESYYLPAGTTLSEDRYILGQMVNSGGFGILYRAWDKVLERVVAIKECYPASLVARPMGSKGIVVNSSRAERFDEYQQILDDYVLEATIMSRFSKERNVCNVYDHFKENNTAYIVMEFLEGQDLKSYRRENKTMSLEEKDEIMMQILDGLEVLHKEGVVHRDIAPDNIYICKDENGNATVKIIDFGIATVEGKKRLKDRVVVKPGYTPPEQYITGGETGPWTDVYATGATLYFLYTGEVPAEVTDRQRGATLVEPKQIEARIPRALDAAIMCALSTDIESRFQTIRELKECIVRKKMPPAPVAKGDGDKSGKKKKKGKAGIVIGCIFALLLLVVGAFFLLKDKFLTQKQSLTVWVGTSEDSKLAKLEERRYEELFDLYMEQNQGIEITVVTMPEDELVEEFLEASRSERPDLVEVVYGSEKICDELDVLSFVKQDDMAEEMPGVVKASKKLSYQAIPVARAAQLCFLSNGSVQENATEVTTMDAFLTGQSGVKYYEDSSAYAEIQEKIPGRYTVEAIKENPEIWYTDFFGVCNGKKNEEVAEAVLVFMLSDEAQDVLHIQNDSSMLPVTEDALKDYVKVYNELSFLKEEIETYAVKVQMSREDLYRDAVPAEEEQVSTPTEGVASEKIVVEDVKGMDATEAQKKLEASGLGVSFEMAYSKDVPVKKVISQSPKAGETVERGSLVVLTVSQEKEEVALTPVSTPEPTAEPVPEHTPTPVPTPTPKPKATATPKPKATATPKPTSTPTPKPLSYLNIHKAKVGNYVSFGTYEQDGDTKNGKEAIEWEVLAVENDRVMLISRYCLDSAPYHSSADGVVWSNSSVRDWLNSTFYINAFSASEQKNIMATEIENASNKNYGTFGGENTTDKVYLLSESEVETYFKSNSDRTVKATEYAQKQGVAVDGTKASAGNCEWWLRTLGGDAQKAVTVQPGGSIAIRGCSTQLRIVGVRPVIWVKK